MKICCLMMQKNERALLVPWVRYHAARFGIENLHVYDNGSDDPDTISALEEMEREGLNVVRDHRTKSDFENKGSIIAAKIRSLDAEGGYDFYFPLDCDEFICVRRDGKLGISRADIEEELANHVGEDRVLYIGGALFNNPVLPDEYMLVEKPEKCFFFRDTCESLDIGFHNGKSKKSSERTGTAIAYFHFHNKPYDDYIFHAKQKMKGRLENFGRGDAVRYIAGKGAGAHLVGRMIRTREDYNSQFAERRNDPFPVNEIVNAPELRTHLEEIGAPMKWRPEDEKPEPAGQGREDRTGHDIFGWWVDNGPNLENMNGHLDAFRNDGEKITFGGWASDRDGQPAPQLIVMADTQIVPLREFKAVTRTDVNEVFPGTSPYCGFHVVVDIADIPDDTREIRLVAHDPRDRSTCIVKGKTGHSIPWPASVADRNQWKLPAETAAGPRQIVHAWKETGAKLAAAGRTGLERSEYLRLVRDGVAYFSQFQADSGAIIDPYKGEEFQYSTPCFAYAAALCAGDENPALAEKAALAMDWACLTLSERRAATDHEDFYPSPIAHALPLLADKVTPERLGSWREQLAAFDPFQTYRHKVGGTGGAGSNWNCKALAGEYLLHRAGIRNSLKFVEDSLLAQGRLFDNEFGMYAEGPMVYDAFPRAWLGDMVAAGYDGVAADTLKEALDRGAAASLLLQSPNGELPCGGRSAHHVWADALQCVIFELAAARAVQAGDAQLAGMYKRAARKALKAVGAWQRPSGEFWIVRNRSHPSLRHGYEGYSSHSQYNLLALTALGYAYEHAAGTDAIEEQITPSEAGHYVVHLPAPFDKVVACNAGTQVIVSRQRDTNQTPAGLLRVHFGDEVPQIGPSDALIADPAYALPGGKRANLAIGLAWKAGDGWKSIADLDRLSSTVSDSKADAAQTGFRIIYKVGDDGVSEISETYALSGNRLEVDYHVAGTAGALAIRLPVMVSDGVSENRIEKGADFVSVSSGRQTVTYRVDDADISLSGEVYAHRSGYARIATFALKPDSKARLTMECSRQIS